MKIVKGLYCFTLFSMMCLCDASSKKMQVKNTLNFSNKIPFKYSIKSPDGDIIDCVHISHQPAFDHPLLKNHTILMRPSYCPGKGLFGESEMFSSEAHDQDDEERITQLWQLNGRCPEGTIPIRRNQNRSNIKRYAMKQHKSLSHLSAADSKLVNQTGYERAYAYVQGKKYFGAEAYINVWQPQIQKDNEFSSSHIWITGGPDSDINAIEVGWMVFPTLFGDNKTRFFTYWTKDGYQSTGCYNLLCSGFVQISQKAALGAAIIPVSNYYATQYEFRIYIWKDPNEDVWWLQYGRSTILGYWPGSLFTYLASSGSLVGWGGEVVNSASDGQHTTTQMGSGHFPEEKYGGSCYIRYPQVVDESNNLISPDDIATFAEKPNCYNIALTKDDNLGVLFYFGGPGKNDNCP